MVAVEATFRGCTGRTLIIVVVAIEVAVAAVVAAVVAAAVEVLAGIGMATLASRSTVQRCLMNCRHILRP